MKQFSGLLAATQRAAGSIALAIVALMGASSAGAVVMPLNLQAGNYEFTVVGCMGAGLDCEGAIQVSVPDPNFQIDFSDLSRINGVDSFGVNFPGAQSAFIGNEKNRISLYGDRQTLETHFSAFCSGCLDWDNPPTRRIQTFSLYTTSGLSPSLPEGIFFVNRVEERQEDVFGGPVVDLRIYTGFLEVRAITTTTATVVFENPQLTLDQQAIFKAGVFGRLADEIRDVLSGNPLQPSLVDAWNVLPPDSLRALLRRIEGGQINEFPFSVPVPPRVPEPGTLALLGLGLAGLAASRRRK